MWTSFGRVWGVVLLQAAHREVGAMVLKPTLMVWCKDIQNVFCCEVVELVLGIVLGMTMNCADPGKGNSP